MKPPRLVCSYCAKAAGYYVETIEPVRSAGVTDIGSREGAFYCQRHLVEKLLIKARAHLNLRTLEGWQ